MVQNRAARSRWRMDVNATGGVEILERGLDGRSCGPQILLLAKLEHGGG